MFQYIRPALFSMTAFTLLLGLAYPLAMTEIGQAAFNGNANGSLITRDGAVVGSSLIGQSFTEPRYFWPRPSAAGQGYDAMGSSGANLGPTSAKLKERVEGDIARLNEAGITGPMPADAVTASASGLDPHISPEYAMAQIDRVAAARSLPVPAVRQLVTDHIEGAALGILGQERVNVLELNLALDQAAATKG